MNTTTSTTAGATIGRENAAVDFTPAPGAAPVRRMLAAQAAVELREFLRNGEQLLITMIIPLLLLVGFSAMPLLNYQNADRVGFVAPGVVALAIMSTAFTGQAIKTGFDRQYGVLKRLGATPLPRWGLIAAKTLAVVAVELVQLVVIAAVAVALGWRPYGSGAAQAVLFVVLGTAAFSGLAMLMAGTLRAMATLAGANLIYILLLGLGGVFIPLAEFPPAIQPVLTALPITALTQGLRAILRDGAVLPVHALMVLAAWTVASLVAASLTFKWD